MSSIRNVTGTAFVVAEFRNDENKEAHPLFHDPFVHIFLDRETKKIADQISGGFLPIRINVRLRTRYLDEWLRRQIENGCRQVVILGAGLDTRPQRMAARGVTFYEIDAAETQAFKRRKLEENDIEANTTFIGADYVTEGLIDLLIRKELDLALPTHVIWEGNTMYLSDAAVCNVLNDLMRNIRTCSLSFDYMAEEVISDKTGDPEITAVVERFASMGARWTYGVNNLTELADGCGAKILDSVTLSDLYREYWPGRRLASKLYDFYSLCTLGNSAGKSVNRPA
jgi:methyltransferase (TIGR00027 family)